MKSLKQLLAIASDASLQRNDDVIAQFKAEFADELGTGQEKMWCLLLPEDEEQQDDNNDDKESQASFH